MTVKDLICKARELNLENVEILDRYSVEEISVIYNGIGPVSRLAAEDRNGKRRAVRGCGADPRCRI